MSEDEAITKQQQEGYILNIYIYFMVEDTETWWTVWPCLTLWIKYKPKGNWECIRVLETCLILTIAHTHISMDNVKLPFSSSTYVPVETGVWIKKMDYLIMSNIKGSPVHKRNVISHAKPWLNLSRIWK